MIKSKRARTVCDVEFPVIDPIATGETILSLRKENVLTVRNLLELFGFEEPQAIYRWQYGKTLPSVDNLYALSAILDVPMERILVPAKYGNVIQMEKQQELPAASVFIRLIHEEVGIYDAQFFFRHRRSLPKPPRGLCRPHRVRWSGRLRTGCP